jgi:hypothetical protein
MSLSKQAKRGIPAEMERVAKAAFPQVNKYLQLRVEFGDLYTDEAFANLYKTEGDQWSHPVAWRW